ncbi:MAG: hypothetical protein ACLQU3_11760 [Limisphaerales bacterium]
MSQQPTESCTYGPDRPADMVLANREPDKSPYASSFNFDGRTIIVTMQQVHLKDGHPVPV